MGKPPLPMPLSMVICGPPPGAAACASTRQMEKMAKSVLFSSLSTARVGKATSQTRAEAAMADSVSSFILRRPRAYQRCEPNIGQNGKHPRDQVPGVSTCCFNVMRRSGGGPAEARLQIRHLFFGDLGHQH